MSSRLLAMKFMQRAAASKAHATPDKISSPSPEDETYSPKRQRQSTDPNSPSTPQSDLDAIAAALAAEEQKRQEVMARKAAEVGETQWVLDMPAATPPQPQSFVMATESLDADDGLSSGGRRSFGNFKRKEPTPPPVANVDVGQEAKPKLSQISSISGAGGRAPVWGAPTQKKKKRKSGQ
ncbi:hypothetical protein N7490_005887 [Penicillium lividum]|nr:hypothetical protein N7490_005887 [Penicillium lividum]